MEARRRYDGSIADAGRDERNWRALVSEVDAVVRVMPLWKLQRVGGERLDFLYENTGRGTRILLKPAVIGFRSARTTADRCRPRFTHSV